MVFMLSSYFRSSAWRLIRKIIHRERFLQEVKAFVQHAMISDNIGRIAGSKKTFQPRFDSND